MIVDELKKSFLQQAFEGKITYSLNDDTSVEESLKKISVQKQLLIDAYKVRNEPEYKEVSETEFLFSIPKTWRWVRIGQLGVFKKGPFGSALTKSMFVKENENTVKVYEQKNAIQKDIDLGDYYITRDYFESKMKSFEIKAGDIIVSCAGTIGETYVVPHEHKKGIINQALMRMTMVDELNVDYFLKYFDYILKRISNNLSSGSAIKNIPPFDVFKQLLIPLPPIEEQQRIVDKLTELFSKLDEAKTIEEELKILKGKFPNDMKNSIFKFYLNNSNKEYELCELGTFVSGKTPKPNELLNQGTIPYFKVSDMNNLCNDIFLKETENFLCENANYTLFPKNTIVYPKNGGALLTNKRRILFRESLVDLNTGGFIPNKNVYYKYAYYIFKSIDFNHYFKGTALPTLDLDKVKKIKFCLPSLEKQIIIVDKIEKILLLCNDIEEIVN